MRSERVVVHVSLGRFQKMGTGRGFEDWFVLTAKLDDILARHATGWSRPSVDEAVLVGELPWGAGGSPLDWADSLRAAVASGLKLDCSVGIAATRVAARLCSRMARPRGTLLWIAGHEQSLIEGLPLEDLDELRPEQLAKLRSRGIRTLDELASLSLPEARALMGSEGARLVGLVQGSDRVTDGATTSRLVRAVGLLARRLERRLVHEGRRARGLELKLLYADGITRERYLLLPRPTSSVEDLREAAMRLVDMQSKRPQAVGGLALTATGLTGPGGQMELFDGARPRELRVNVGQVSV